MRYELRASTAGKQHPSSVACVQEHHGQPLRHLVFNAMDTDKTNLFATVAHNQVRALLHASKCRQTQQVVPWAVNQATIYDNQHFGSYVAVVEQFVNAKTDFTAGGVRLAAGGVRPPNRPPVRPFPARSADALLCSRNAQDLLAVAWLSSEGTSQTHGDGLLAVGGTDTNVSVISMASASVVALLKGHTNVRRAVRGACSVLTLLLGAPGYPRPRSFARQVRCCQRLCSAVQLLN